MSDKIDDDKFMRHWFPLSYRKQRTTKNQKPEKFLERQVMAWLNKAGFDCQVVESKAVYNAKAGRFLRGMTKAGTCDIMGNTPEGVAVFIELKAKGRLATLADHQRVFLENKIKKNAFACAVDSVALLEKIWQAYSIAAKHDKILAQKALLSALPSIPVKRNV